MSDQKTAEINTLALSWDLPPVTIANRKWLFQQLLQHAVSCPIPISLNTKYLLGKRYPCLQSLLSNTASRCVANHTQFTNALGDWTHSTADKTDQKGAQGHKGVDSAKRKA